MYEIISVAQSVVRLGRKKELPFLASGIAFFAFLSIIPALLLLLALGSVVGGEAFATRTVGLLDIYLSERGSTVIGDALADSTGVVGASIVGFTALLWSVFRVFRAIDIAFGHIYEAERVTSLPWQLFNGSVVVVTIGTGIVLLLLVQALMFRLDLSLFSSVRFLSLLALLVGLLFALAPMYYVMHRCVSRLARPSRGRSPLSSGCSCWSRDSRFTRRWRASIRHTGSLVLSYFSCCGSISPHSFSCSAPS